MTISSEITSMKNSTAQYQAATNDGSSMGKSELDTNAFLKLITAQLQYQDPMDPVSNQEFISQQAALQQVSYLNDISSATTSNAAITQTLALVGKEVTITDPNDSTGKTKITGTVSEASFDSDTATIKLDGGSKQYNVSSVLSVKNPTTTTN